MEAFDLPVSTEVGNGLNIVSNVDLAFPIIPNSMPSSTSDSSGPATACIMYNNLAECLSKQIIEN